MLIIAFASSDLILSAYHSIRNFHLIIFIVQYRLCLSRCSYTLKHSLSIVFFSSLDTLLNRTFIILGQF